MLERRFNRENISLQIEDYFSMILAPNYSSKLHELFPGIVEEIVNQLIDESIDLQELEVPLILNILRRKISGRLMHPDLEKLLRKKESSSDRNPLQEQLQEVQEKYVELKRKYDLLVQGSQNLPNINDSQPISPNYLSKKYPPSGRILTQRDKLILNECSISLNEMSLKDLVSSYSINKSNRYWREIENMSKEEKINDVKLELYFILRDIPNAQLAAKLLGVTVATVYHRFNKLRTKLCPERLFESNEEVILDVIDPSDVGFKFLELKDNLYAKRIRRKVVES